MESPNAMGILGSDFQASLGVSTPQGPCRRHELPASAFHAGGTAGPPRGAGRYRRTSMVVEFISGKS